MLVGVVVTPSLDCYCKLLVEEVVMIPHSADFPYLLRTLVEVEVADCPLLFRSSLLLMVVVLMDSRCILLPAA